MPRKKMDKLAFLIFPLMFTIGFFISYFAIKLSFLAISLAFDVPTLAFYSSLAATFVSMFSGLVFGLYFLLLIRGRG
ncbi:MAG: hypothetical protein QXF83_06915 [Candidatus Bathyarchaeia archaeon]